MMKRIFLCAFLGFFLIPLLSHADKTLSKKKGPVGISGWVIFWDQGNKSLADFEKHANQIDRAYFEWCHLTPAGMPEPIPDLKPEMVARAMAAARKNGVETWYMIGNWDNAIMDHNKVWVEKFLYDSDLRAKHIQWLINYAKQNGVNGIQIDYENLLAKDKGAFSNFMQEMGKACKANGFLLGIALPPKVDSEGTWDDPQSRDYGAIGKAADEFVPMTYDLHWSTSTAGAVTSPEWAEEVIKYSASVMDPSKLEVGYPAYGYDWVGNKGNSITWTQFEDSVKKYRAVPERDTDYSQELHITYKDEKGVKHEAWMPDSRCLEYQADIVKRYHLYGLGVWFFGSEDESFWTTMAKVNSTTAETSKLLPVEVSAPKKFGIQHILTDDQTVMYSYAYPEGGSKISIVEKQGKRWVDIALKGDAWSGAGLGLNRANFLPYVAKGALQFCIKGTKGGEVFDVGMVMEKNTLSDEDKFNFEDSVPITNYTQVTTKWQWVTIPLADFPPSGHHYDEKNGQQVKGTFKWNKVIEFTLAHAPNADPVDEILISSIRILPSYNPKELAKQKAAIEQ
jgi:spore germination protein